MFSSLSVFVYQGSITIGASLLEKLLVPEVINQMSAVGRLLIITLGLNMIVIKRIRVGNMLSSLFLPLLHYALRQCF